MQPKALIICYRTKHQPCELDIGLSISRVSLTSSTNKEAPRRIAIGHHPRRIDIDLNFVDLDRDIDSVYIIPAHRQGAKHSRDTMTFEMCSVGDALVEILNGLRTYFDKSLSAMLLYKPERGKFLEHVLENSTIAITPRMVKWCEAFDVLLQ